MPDTKQQVLSNFSQPQWKQLKIYRSEILHEWTFSGEQSALKKKAHTILLHLLETNANTDDFILWL
jgi:hypothetical protein